MTKTGGACGCSIGSGEGLKTLGEEGGGGKQNRGSKFLFDHIAQSHSHIGKGIARGAEWHKFQLRSAFQLGVMIMIKTMVHMV